LGSKTLKPKNILNRSKVRSGIDIRLHNDHYANQNWDAKCKYNNSYGKQPQEISDTTKRHPKQNAMTLFSKSVGTLACDEETKNVFCYKWSRLSSRRGKTKRDGEEFDAL